MNELDVQATAMDRALYDDILKEKAPEVCLYCDQDVVFDDGTECWLARRTAYHCPDATPSPHYGLQSHEV